MDTKKTLIGLAVLFAVINAGVGFAANEAYRGVYSGFGIEDPDPDLDGVVGNKDKCPGTPFDITVITQDSKKNKAVISFAGGYLRAKKVDKSVTFQASATADFASPKEYAVASGKVIAIPQIKKRIRVLYSNAQKGVTVVWMANLEGTVAGCATGEHVNDGSAPVER